MTPMVARDAAQAFLRSAELSQTSPALASDQGFEPEFNQGRLLFNAGQFGGALQSVFIYIQCRSHMHEYARFMHTCQGAEDIGIICVSFDLV